MNRDQKASVVAELAEQIRSVDTIFAVDYRGISVSDAAALRGRLRDADTRFRIVKNSLTERASDEAGAESLKPMLEGPTALAFVSGDVAVAAKALNDAARSLGTLEFKGGLMQGATLTGEDIRSIARLPAREVLHGQLVGTIAAPLSGLVRTLNALISGLALQLGQIAEQGLMGQGEAATKPASAPTEAAPEEAAPEAAAPEAAAPEAAAEEAPAETAEEPVPEEGASGSEALAPEAAADPSDAEAPSASDADTPSENPETENETDASAGEAEAT